MRAQLEALRADASALEVSAEQRAEWHARVDQHAEAFLERLPQLPVFNPPEGDSTPVLGVPLSGQPAPLNEVLGLLRDHVETAGVNLGSPGMLAFVPPSGLYTAALGDYLATIINRYAGYFFAAPGAVSVERAVLRWMADLVGYPAAAAGDLTSGGSIATLIAVVTAREAHALRAQAYPRAVVYRSSQTHHALAKALRIAGLGECVQREIPLDPSYRMRPEALEAAIRQDQRAGYRPWLVVASAGTTDTGAVDPLAAIATVAQQHQLWLHVDGAYGAMFALCPAIGQQLAGIERSDSLVLDPHKGMFMPCGSGAVLVRDAVALLRAHSFHADYLQDIDTLLPPEQLSPAELSPELTRPFRGLRLWLSLKLFGVAPFRAALEEKLLLARYFYARLQELPGFAVGPPPDLSIVTFRYLPKQGDANSFNRLLAAAVQRDGRIFLSSTTIGGEITLRLAILNLTTHLETIELALEVLAQKAHEIERGVW